MSARHRSTVVRSQRRRHGFDPRPVRTDGVAARVVSMDDLTSALLGPGDKSPSALAFSWRAYTRPIALPGRVHHRKLEALLCKRKSQPLSRAML